MCQVQEKESKNVYLQEKKIEENNSDKIDLQKEIHSYWTERARGYSEYNQQEMADDRRSMWKKKLLSMIREKLPEKKPSQIKIMDAGTGPGFFAILLAEAGYQVTAVDATEEMLKEARKNAGMLSKIICWKTEDVQDLKEEDSVFDIVVSRNVTWNLQNPEQAYREWFRVLKKGGALFNFDADWYGHLFDQKKRKEYEKDRQLVKEKDFEDYYMGTDIARMETIARQVPLSRMDRPQWDMETMKKAGFQNIYCDETVWREVWTEEEIINNSSTPVFLLTGEK